MKSQYSKDLLLIEPPKRLIAFDPGKATGWAIFQDGLPKDFGDIRGLSKLDDFLIALDDIDFAVYEDFRLYSHKALQQSGSHMEASQAIGKIEIWAKMRKIACIAQPANVLPVAQLWSKMKMPRNHDKSHHISAYNHAVYYLVKNKMMLPVGI